MNWKNMRKHRTKLLIIAVVALCAISLYGYEKISTIRDINLIKEKVANEFKDPESVKFRNLKAYSYGGVSLFDIIFSARSLSDATNLIKIWRESKELLGKPTLCGEANAKNQFGAYVGYEKFYADEIAIFYEKDSYQLINEFCSGKDKISLFYPQLD